MPIRIKTMHLCLSFEVATIDSIIKQTNQSHNNIKQLIH